MFGVFFFTPLNNPIPIKQIPHPPKNYFLIPSEKIKNSQKNIPQTP